MTRLVINIVFFIILAVFIALNAIARTDVNLFGFKLTEVPTIAVILVSMAVGVLYSFSFYLSSYFSRIRKQRQKGRKQENTLKEKELIEREKYLVSDRPSEEELPDADIGAPESEPAEVVEEKKSKKRSGKKKRT